MVRRVLARSCGHDIVADFESDEEYLRFCGAVMDECISSLMAALSLEELILIWQERNSGLKTEIHHRNKYKKPPPQP